MAEKIIYEVEIQGFAEAFNLIGGLENRLTNIKFGAITAINKELATTIGSLKEVRKMVTAGFSANTAPLGRSLQSTSVITEIKRAAASVRREHEQAGVKDVLRRLYVPRLGWNGGWDANIDEDSRTASEHARERHEYAELKRAGNRAFANRQYDIVPRGATYDVVPVESQTSLQRLDEIHQRFNTPPPNGSNVVGLSTLGKIVKGFGIFKNIVGVFTKVTSPIMAAITAIKRVTKALHNFGSFILRANESWRLLRESHAYGTSMSSLSDAWGRITQLGGDRASASALWNRWSRERSMLAFGGDGGSLMEAARLFGLNIRGSGEYGFATNDELARNIVKTMDTLSKSQQVAMKNVLGLDDYHFWAMSNGMDYFNEITEKSRTISQNFARFFELDDSLYPRVHSDASREFEGAWGELVRSFEELGAAIGVYLLPVLTELMKIISKIVQLVTWFLNLPRWVFESLERLLNVISGVSSTTNEEIGKTESQTEIQARLNAASRGIGHGDRAVVINIGDISLNTLGLPNDATPEQIKKRTGEVIWNHLGDALTDNRR